MQDPILLVHLSLPVLAFALSRVAPPRGPLLSLAVGAVEPLLVFLIARRTADNNIAVILVSYGAATAVSLLVAYGGSFLHETKAGRPDRRFSNNPFSHIFSDNMRASAIRTAVAAGFITIVLLCADFGGCDFVHRGARDGESQTPPTGETTQPPPESPSEKPDAAQVPVPDAPAQTPDPRILRKFGDPEPDNDTPATRPASLPERILDETTPPKAAVGLATQFLQARADSTPLRPVTSALNTRGYRLFNANARDDALPLFLLAARFDPQYGMPRYNAARIYALRGETENCVRMLAELKRLGSAQRARLRNAMSDPSFDRVRSSPSFRTLFE